MIQIEFDPKKAAMNLRKHGVSFEDAKTVFFDPNAITVENFGDCDEVRYETLGMDLNMRLLVVIWTDRTPNIRLISAWRADKLRRAEYDNQY